MSLKINYTYSLSLIIGTFILSWVAMQNEFPLVYSDTGTYILSAHTSEVPRDRPKMYGEFINLTSNYSLWGTIIAQNLILCFVLLDFLKILFRKRQTTLSLVLITFLVATTGISWYSSQIMPDIFTPILLLTSLNLFLRKEKSYAPIIINSIIIILSISFHNSHVVIAVLLGALFIATILLKKHLRFLNNIHFLKSKVSLIIGIYALGILTAPIVHYTYEGTFNFSKYSHVILLSKFAENGILKSYLNEKCDNEQFKKEHDFCSCHKNITTKITDFLYAPNSPVNLNSGWSDESKKEYYFFIRDILSQPKYLVLTITSTIQNTFSQLFSIKIGSGLEESYDEGSPPYFVIHEFYPDEAQNYDASLQNKELLNLSSINIIHNYMLVLSVIFVLFLKYYSTFITTEQLIALVVSCFGILINSIATGGLHRCYDRFQTRIVWVLPMIILVIIISNRKDFIKLIKEKTTA